MCITPAHTRQAIVLCTKPCPLGEIALKQTVAKVATSNAGNVILMLMNQAPLTLYRQHFDERTRAGDKSPYQSYPALAGNQIVESRHEGRFYARWSSTSSWTVCLSSLSRSGCLMGPAIKR
ncbi:hypothetical protein ABIB83_008954 [Bradyrhizobium sp. I1.8.5]